MDKAREAAQRPSESLLGALQAAELSWDDTDRLRDYLLLRGEISRHREDPHAYEPPAGDIDRHGVESLVTEEPNTWKLISAFRKGADQVVEAAYRFGMGFHELGRADGHRRAASGFRPCRSAAPRRGDRQMRGVLRPGRSLRQKPPHPRPSPPPEP